MGRPSWRPPAAAKLAAILLLCWLAEQTRANRQPPVQRDGQRESFSVQWTGLGDLEASDALKKMMKRSGSPPRPTGQLYALLRLPEPPATSRPILVRRRAAEELLQEPVEGPDEPATLGEFGSRISLLTTRKQRPESNLLGADDDLSSGWTDDTEPLPSRILIGDFTARRRPTGQTLTLADELARSNYMPRIARANSM